MLRNLLGKLAGIDWWDIGGFFVKNWQTVLAGAFLLSVFHYCRARDAEHVEAGKAEQRSLDMAKLAAKYRQDAAEAAESVAVMDNRLDAQHAGYEQALGRLGTTLHRVDTLALERWLHDTVQVGDTIRVPAKAILQADTLLHACTDYMSTCEQFRIFAAKRFAADSQRIAILSEPTKQPGARRCGIQLTAGAAGVAKSTHEYVFGPGATLGVGCRW